jgi:hypothetical protein
LGDVDVQYVWRFLMSTILIFVAKAADVVGLYVAKAFCASTRSLRSTHWSEHKRTRPNRQSHDYKRYGTTTLFAALEVATGKIIASHSRRRRGVEFLGSMNSVVAAFPDNELHVILDNLNTHKKNERWLKNT